MQAIAPHAPTATKPAPLAPAPAPAPTVELGSVDVLGWNDRTKRDDVRSMPARGIVYRTGFADAASGARLLIEEYYRDPSAATGYVAFQRNGATWDAVLLDHKIADGFIHDFHAAPGVDVDAIWYLGGYWFPAWERPAASTGISAGA